MHTLHFITPALLFSVVHGAAQMRPSAAKLESGDEFIPFSQFLTRAATATYNNYDNTAVQDAGAFANMKTHIKEMYGGVVDPASIESYIRDGEYVDCIPFMQQPTIHVLKLTPADLLPLEDDMQSPNLSVPKDEPQYALPTPLPGSTDTFGHLMQCTNKTTVPIRRISLERMTKFPDLKVFFSAPTAPPPDNSTQPTQRLRRDVPRGSDGLKRLHVGGINSPPSPRHYFGARAAINIWSPVAALSTSQFWLTVDSPVQQTVTTGSIVNKNIDTKSRFVAGYLNAPGSGCYNADCAGFVQDPGVAPLGSVWSHYSTPGTANQWESTLLFEQSTAGWSLYFVLPDGTRRRVGYYPHTLFERTSGSLSWGADRVNFGGFVTDTVASPNTFGQMGSGKLASEGLGFAAFQRVLQVFTVVAGGPRTWEDAALAPISHDRRGCFSWRNVIPSAGGSVWRTVLWFGGPGGSKCDSSP